MADAPHGSNEGPLAGLTSEQAQAGLLEHGRNEIPETVALGGNFSKVESECFFDGGVGAAMRSAVSYFIV